MDWKLRIKTLQEYGFSEVYAFYNVKPKFLLPKFLDTCVWYFAGMCYFMYTQIILSDMRFKIYCHTCAKVFQYEYFHVCSAAFKHFTPYCKKKIGSPEGA